MMISVVIPCYNRSSIVGRAIASVLQQTHRELEIIVVDDGSDDRDGLVNVVEGFSDPRIRLVGHSKNLGGAAARNTGVALAQGFYIAFLDSDDEWMPTKLEKQLAFAKLQPDSKWLIYCQSKVLTTQISGAHESIMPSQEIKTTESVGDYLFVAGGWLPTPAMFLTKQLAAEVPFNSRLKRHQDYDFLLQLEAKGCRFFMVPEPLVIVHWEDFHQTARGLNSRNSIDFLKEYAYLLSPRARSGFVVSQIVRRLAVAGYKLEAMRYAIVYTRPWHLSLVQYISIFSILVLGDARLAAWLASLKRSLIKRN